MIVIHFQKTPCQLISNNQNYSKQDICVSSPGALKMEGGQIFQFAPFCSFVAYFLRFTAQFSAEDDKYGKHGLKGDSGASQKPDWRISE